MWLCPGKCDCVLLLAACLHCPDFCDTGRIRKTHIATSNFFDVSKHSMVEWRCQSPCTSSFQKLRIGSPAAQFASHMYTRWNLILKFDLHSMFTARGFITDTAVIRNWAGWPHGQCQQHFFHKDEQNHRKSTWKRWKAIEPRWKNVYKQTAQILRADFSCEHWAKNCMSPYESSFLDKQLPTAGTCFPDMGLISHGNLRLFCNHRARIAEHWHNHVERHLKFKHNRIWMDLRHKKCTVQFWNVSKPFQTGFLSSITFCFSLS